MTLQALLETPITDFHGDTISAHDILGEYENWSLEPHEDTDNGAILCYTEHLPWHQERLENNPQLFSLEGELKAHDELKKVLESKLGVQGVVIDQDSNNEGFWLEIYVPLFFDYTPTVGQVYEEAQSCIADLVNGFDPGTFGATYFFNDVLELV